MTQIASVLAVATVFIIGLWTLITRHYTQDKNTYAGTRAKSAGGAYRRIPRRSVKEC